MTKKKNKKHQNRSSVNKDYHHFFFFFTFQQKLASVRFCLYCPKCFLLIKKQTKTFSRTLSQKHYIQCDTKYTKCRSQFYSERNKEEHTSVTALTSCCSYLIKGAGQLFRKYFSISTYSGQLATSVRVFHQVIVTGIRYFFSIYCTVILSKAI